MSSIIGGLLFLTFTLWQIRRGEAELLFWLGGLGIDITRAGNPLLFWITICGQLALSLGWIAWSLFKITR